MIPSLHLGNGKIIGSLVFVVYFEPGMQSAVSDKAFCKYPPACQEYQPVHNRVWKHGCQGAYPPAAENKSEYPVKLSKVLFYHNVAFCCFFIIVFAICKTFYTAVYFYLR